MAPQATTTTEVARRETMLLQRLLNLYEEEKQIYRQVWNLSLRQGEIVKQGLPLSDVRKILDQKKRCLETISRLELTESSNKVEWEQGRQKWSSSGRTQLHEKLQEVTELIEEILVIEEKNDMHLIEQTQVM